MIESRIDRFLSQFNISPKLERGEEDSESIIKAYLQSSLSDWSVNIGLVSKIMQGGKTPWKCMLEIQNAINISEPGSIDEIKHNTTIKLILTDGYQIINALIMQKKIIPYRALTDLLNKKIALSTQNCTVIKGVILIKQFQIILKYNQEGNKEQFVEDEQEAPNNNQYQNTIMTFGDENSKSSFKSFK